MNCNNYNEKYNAFYLPLNKHSLHTKHNLSSIYIYLFYNNWLVKHLKLYNAKGVKRWKVCIIMMMPIPSLTRKTHWVQNSNAEIPAITSHQTINITKQCITNSL